jgi:zinc transport system ATP-binding protein
MSSVLELENVNVSYAGISALEDVSLIVEQGDFVGLVGPNGSGKSTLIKAIFGLVPYSGAIKIFGEPLNKAVKLKLYSRIGYIPQHIFSQAQSFPATVFEVTLTGKVAQKSLFNGFTKNDYQKAASALTLAGMYELKDRRIGELSGGQLQRVFIARAIVNDPELLILDEPTSGVDAFSQAQFYSILEELNKKRKITVILATHDITAITKLSNKIACINKKMSLSCDIEEFLHGEQVSKLYQYPTKGIDHHHE